MNRDHFGTAQPGIVGNLVQVLAVIHGGNFLQPRRRGRLVGKIAGELEEMFGYLTGFDPKGIEENK